MIKWMSFIITGLLQKWENLQVIIVSQNHSPFNRIGIIHM